MNENTLYLIDYETHLKIFNIDYTHVINQKLKLYLDEILLTYLTTCEGRTCAIKKLLNYYYNIPYYINDHLLLIKVQSSPNIWANYYNIGTIKNNAISFKNGKTIKVKRSKKTLLSSLSKAKRLNEIIKGREIRTCLIKTDNLKKDTIKS